MSRDADATRRRLLEAARQEFAAYGIAGSRVDRIAAAGAEQQGADLSLLRQQERPVRRRFDDMCRETVDAVPIDPANLPEYARAGCSTPTGSARGCSGSRRGTGSNGRARATCCRSCWPATQRSRWWPTRRRAESCRPGSPRASCSGWSCTCPASGARTCPSSTHWSTTPGTAGGPAEGRRRGGLQRPCCPAGHGPAAAAAGSTLPCISGGTGPSVLLDAGAPEQGVSEMPGGDGSNPGGAAGSSNDRMIHCDPAHRRRAAGDVRRAAAGHFQGHERAGRVG